VLMILPGELRPYHASKQGLQIRCVQPDRPHAGMRSCLRLSEQQREQVPCSVFRRETQDCSSPIRAAVLRIAFPLSVRVVHSG
jgi:hypothetical protein